MLGSLSDHEDHRPLQRKAPACGVWELSADDSTTVRLLRGGWNIPSWGKWSAPGPDHIGKEEGHTRDVQIRLDCIKVHEEDMLIWAVPC